MPDVLDFVTFPVLFFFSPLETQGLVFEEKVNKEELAWRYVVGVTLFSEHWRKPSFHISLPDVRLQIFGKHFIR